MESALRLTYISSTSILWINQICRSYPQLLIYYMIHLYNILILQENGGQEIYRRIDIQFVSRNRNAFSSSSTFSYQYSTNLWRCNSFKIYKHYSDKSIISNLQKKQQSNWWNISKTDALIVTPSRQTPFCNYTLWNIQVFGSVSFDTVLYCTIL